MTNLASLLFLKRNISVLKGKKKILAKIKKEKKKVNAIVIKGWN